MTWIAWVVRHCLPLSAQNAWSHFTCLQLPHYAQNAQISIRIVSCAWAPTNAPNARLAFTYYPSNPTTNPLVSAKPAAPHVWDANTTLSIVFLVRMGTCFQQAEDVWERWELSLRLFLMLRIRMCWINCWLICIKFWRICGRLIRGGLLRSYRLRKGQLRL